MCYGRPPGFLASVDGERGCFSAFWVLSVSIVLPVGGWKIRVVLFVCLQDGIRMLIVYPPVDSCLGTVIPEPETVQSSDLEI